MTDSRAVLILGVDPKNIDFSDPAVPPGMGASKVMAGLIAAQNRLVAQGHSADLCLIDTGETAEATIAEQLAGSSYDCIVIGAGIRTIRGI